MSTQSLQVVDEVSIEDGRRMLAQQVSDRLGISLDEFLERYDSHAYDDSDDEQIFRLIMLIPYAR